MRAASRGRGGGAPARADGSIGGGAAAAGKGSRNARVRCRMHFCARALPASRPLGRLAAASAVPSRLPLLLPHLHPPAPRRAAPRAQLQELQHHRFEFFTHNNAVRRLLHVAVASDASLYPALLSDMHSHLEIQGHMRYSSCVYAVGKVMDSITAVARCALEVGDKLRELPSTPGSAAGGRGPSAWQ